ncbi:MAG: hypothetical protein JWN34_898 [Bryobacterales bacterium]|nr:hypothetical protein [Bryobacterales bacterium]
MVERPAVPFWMWPNVLSLDAPIIAVLWQDFLNRCYPATLHPAGRIVLGLTVWAVYLADRLLDVRHPAKAPTRDNDSVRHAFYRRHPTFARLLLATVLAADALIVALWLRPAVLATGLVVGAGVALYLAMFPLRQWSALASKKPAAALLFTAGVFLITWVGTLHPTTQLAGPAAVFCGLCLANLRLVQGWDVARRQGWLLLFAAVGLRAVTRGLPWFTAVELSAAGLGTLALAGPRISWNARGVLADVALLTPILFR